MKSLFKNLTVFLSTFIFLIVKRYEIMLNTLKVQPGFLLSERTFRVSLVTFVIYILSIEKAKQIEQRNVWRGRWRGLRWQSLKGSVCHRAGLETSCPTKSNCWSQFLLGSYEKERLLSPPVQRLIIDSIVIIYHHHFDRDQHDHHVYRHLEVIAYRPLSMKISAEDQSRSKRTWRPSPIWWSWSLPCCSLQ